MFVSFFPSHPDALDDLRVDISLRPLDHVPPPAGHQGAESRQVEQGQDPEGQRVAGGLAQARGGPQEAGEGDAGEGADVDGEVEDAEVGLQLAVVLGLPVLVAAQRDDGRDGEAPEADQGQAGQAELAGRKEQF